VTDGVTGAVKMRDTLPMSFKKKDPQKWEGHVNCARGRTSESFKDTEAGKSGKRVLLGGKERTYGIDEVQSKGTVLKERKYTTEIVEEWTAEDMTRKKRRVRVKLI